MGFTYGSPFADYNRPVISDSLIYITAVNQSSAIADHPTLYCLNKTTGSIIWSHDLVGNILSAAAVFTTPIVIKDKVIALAHVSDPVALGCPEQLSIYIRQYANRFYFKWDHDKFYVCWKS